MFKPPKQERIMLPKHTRPSAGRKYSIRWIRFLPAVLWMAVIFILSSRSGSELSTWMPYVNRVLPGLKGFDPMHYVAYFVLALTVAYGLGSLSWTWKGFLLNVVICVLYGLSDEWHQSFVPNRSPEWADIGRDAIGSAAAGSIVLLAGRWRRLRRTHKPAKNYRA
jgi:VanZ family protein